MSNERRFQDHEVREILDLAIGRDAAATLPMQPSDGLTLQELQEVGREVGLPPLRISEAVAALAARGEALPRSTSLGLPTSVGSIVPLSRHLSDREWERLVAELRTTFETKGEIVAHGSLREWSSGSLHAFVEPTGTGYRLRLTDSRSAAFGVALAGGGFLIAFALMIFLVLLGKADAGSKLFVPLFFALGGTGAIALTARTLPGWAREQEHRMQHIGTFATLLLATPASPEEAPDIR